MEQRCPRVNHPSHTVAKLQASTWDPRDEPSRFLHQHSLHPHSSQSENGKTSGKKSQASLERLHPSRQYPCLQRSQYGSQGPELSHLFQQWQEGSLCDKVSQAKEDQRLLTNKFRNQVPCIRYPSTFWKGSVLALLDSGSEVNALHPTFAIELGFQVRPIA